MTSVIWLIESLFEGISKSDKFSDVVFVFITSNCVLRNWKNRFVVFIFDQVVSFSNFNSVGLLIFWFLWWHRHNLFYNKHIALWVGMHRKLNFHIIYVVWDYIVFFYNFVNLLNIILESDKSWSHMVHISVCQCIYKINNCIINFAWLNLKMSVDLIFGNIIAFVCCFFDFLTSPINLFLKNIAFWSLFADCKKKTNNKE